MARSLTFEEVLAKVHEEYKADKIRSVHYKTRREEVLEQELKAANAEIERLLEKMYKCWNSYGITDYKSNSISIFRESNGNGACQRRKLHGNAYAPVGHYDFEKESCL